MKKIVLVTGGAGFIGSHLCEELHNTKRYKVFSLDNYFTGSKVNHIEGVTYIEGSTNEIDDHINFSPDYIYHLGEYSRVEQSFDDFEYVWKNNISGIFSILQFCKKKGAKLIYAGSSTKFVKGGKGKKQSPYAWSKASNTELVTNYAKWFNISFAITYFYNVYGPREISSGKYATLIGIFKKKFLNNENLPVVKPGLQRRNFTHIDDIISGLILIGENGEGDNFGIGARESYSVMEVAKMFGSKMVMLPERPGNRLSGELITHKTESLGWSPKKFLKDYIKNLVQKKSKFEVK